jgi:hypothetical protein
MRDLERMDAVQPSTGNIGTVGVLIGQGRAIAPGIPFLAIDHAGMAADADVEVDDKPKLLWGGLRGEQGHSAHSCP